MLNDTFEWPARFLDLKRELVSATTQDRLTASWTEIISELATRTAEIVQAGPNFIPQVKFADLDRLTPDDINTIKSKGCVVIRGVVDTKTASGWKTDLEEFIKVNPHTPSLVHADLPVRQFPDFLWIGIPENNRQFFQVYWTRPQVHARGHPNVLKASAWVSQLYHVKSGKVLEGVDLSVPLTYGNRFRIRRPGTHFDFLPPHIDGASIERWEDKTFRRCFEDIFTGNWRQHDPYELEHRSNGCMSLYHRLSQTSVLRTFQGWLSMTETEPTQGTLQVFPDVQLSNAYIALRPFFRPTVSEDSPDILDPKNWTLDVTTADFPGILPLGNGYTGPLPTPELHPHLRLGETMTSVPKVNPGDMVFWHCDLIHAVEEKHAGTADSAVLYIAALPKTPQNSAYVAKQLPRFLEGESPPDYPKHGKGSGYFTGLATEADLKDPISRIAMGLPI